MLTDLAALGSGQTLEVADGIYEVGQTVNIPAGATVKAAAGARPVITGTNGLPAGVVIGNGATVQGLWLGGAWADIDNGKVVVMGRNCLVEGCTFFGYTNAIIEGDGYANTYRGNRFVNCGRGWLSHPMYLAGGNHPDKGDVVEGNLFAACQGWSIHIWHIPANITVRGNFVGRAAVTMALAGAGHSVTDNILWSSSNPSTFTNFGEATGCVFKRNVIGAGNPGQMHGPLLNSDDDGNYWRRVPVGAAFDTAKTLWTEADVLVNLGVSEAQIEAALDALAAAFQNDTATIHADSTIEPHFTLLAGVVSTWAA